MITKKIYSVGRSQLTNRIPPREIPTGCYDTGDGFYNPKTRVIVDYNMKFLRNAGKSIKTRKTQTCYDHEMHLYNSEVVLSLYTWRQIEQAESDEQPNYTVFEAPFHHANFHYCNSKTQISRMIMYRLTPLFLNM